MGLNSLSQQGFASPCGQSMSLFGWRVCCKLWVANRRWTVRSERGNRSFSLLLAPLDANTMALTRKNRPVCQKRCWRKELGGISRGCSQTVPPLSCVPFASLLRPTLKVELSVPLFVLRIMGCNRTESRELPREFSAQPFTRELVF